jgi:hypothetical protein
MLCAARACGRRSLLQGRVTVAPWVEDANTGPEAPPTPTVFNYQSRLAFIARLRDAKVAVSRAFYTAMRVAARSKTVDRARQMHKPTLIAEVRSLLDMDNPSVNAAFDRVANAVIQRRVHSPGGLDHRACSAAARRSWPPMPNLPLPGSRTWRASRR